MINDAYIHTNMNWKKIVIKIKVWFFSLFLSDKVSFIKTVAAALYGNIGCGVSCLLMKKLLYFCQKVNRVKGHFHIIWNRVLQSPQKLVLKYGSELIVSFLYKCSTLLSLLLCPKNERWSKNIKLTKNLWCFVPGTV